MQNKLQTSVFYSLLILVTGGFLWMLGSYLYPVFWALVFAVIFYPVFDCINRVVVGKRGLAALLTTLGIVILLAVPSIWFGSLVVQESGSMYRTFSNGSTNPLSIANHSNWLSAHVAQFGIETQAVSERLETWSSTIEEWISDSLITFSQITLTFLIHTGIMLYLLFFLFRDGPTLQTKLIAMLPLREDHERRLILRFAETTRAVVVGTLLIALIQGIIGGVTFWIAGLSAPVLWGAAMMILAIIPAVGPSLIWLPASIYLLATGPIWAGILVFIVGALLVSVIDEFLRPTLVGRNTKMPDALILLATVGGLATFGVSGLVVGPVVAAFFLSLWTMFEEHYQQPAVLTSNDPKKPKRRSVRRLVRKKKAE